LKPALLAIDVGNSSTHFGLFLANQSRPALTYRFPTHQIATAASKKKLRSLLSNKPAVLISSVVPGVNSALQQVITAQLKTIPHFVSATTPSLIRVKYSRPKEVGADRIVNARAAFEFFHGPSIVVDFGTATTFDCVSERGEYLGGVIAPGPVISAEALYERTAKLPKVVLKKPALILGRDTISSIESGLYHGYRGLVKEIVLQLKKKLGKNTRVFATGGQAQWILRGLPVVDHFDEFLTLKGLFYLWQDQAKHLKHN
jgi:type III pantothenate kinase